MIDIVTAEQVLDLFDKKKTTPRRKMLEKMIHQVHQRRDWIKNYLLIVEILSLQFDKKNRSLEKLICHLNDREERLDQGLAKVNTQQKELERRQARMEHELQSMRVLAERCRDKKLRSESQYHRVASVPLLSSKSKKRYLEAQDRNARAEQQLSETREALEKCKSQLRVISNTRSRQSIEQDQLALHRRRSIDAIQMTQQQLTFLQEGSIFWTEFDDYQAQVVLESAEYLAALGERIEPSSHESLDVNQVWLKTFRFACFEYGDRESEGLSIWGNDQLEILFECEQCRLACTGWPRIVNEHELVCNLCFESPNLNCLNDNEDDIDNGYSDDRVRMVKSKSKMKMMMRHLFSYSKIGPLSAV
ncbi:hypothetical protein BD560DRAFT_384974 [Blakeslea trispora]|nr:hypothetical protein BD560DRAFT_384974 [Blakeslea trispora]